MFQKINIGFLALVLMSGTAWASHSFDDGIEDLRKALEVLEMEAPFLNQRERIRALHQMNHLDRRIHALKEELKKPPSRWVQLPKGSTYGCTAACANQQMRPAPSPEGAYCTSGENAMRSAISAGIQFHYGTFGTVKEKSNANGFGLYCYRTPQKKDNDQTDLAVGCYCE